MTVPSASRTDFFAGLELGEEALELSDVLCKPIGAATAMNLPVKRAVAHSGSAVVLPKPFVQLRRNRLGLKAEVGTNHISPWLWRRLQVAEHLWGDSSV